MLIHYRGKQYRAALSELVELGSDGALWYVQGKEELQSYGTAVKRDAGELADLLAILSPRVSVSRNVAMLRAWVEARSFLVGTMHARRRAVLRYESDGTINGPKVRSFAAALRGDGSVVVVDAWVTRALGLRTISSKKQYMDAAARIRRLATRHDMQPAQAQAALWVGCRRLVGVVDAVSPLGLV